MRDTWVLVGFVSVLMTGCFGKGSTGSTSTCPPGVPGCDIPPSCDPTGDAGCPDDNGTTPGVGTGALGKACTKDADCISSLRLVCMDKTCAFGGDLEKGSACTATGECMQGLYCSVESDAKCTPAGAASEGARCESTAECARGLVCGYAGLTKKCLLAGTGDIGSECKNTTECVAGLFCPPPMGNTQSRCLPTPAPDKIAAANWTGLKCADDEAAATAYFHVPRGDETDKDFFRLPFPNDVRRTDEGLDLRGFPSPGDFLGLGDLVGSYVNATTDEVTGFATNPVVYFRFSEKYRGASQETVWLFDIDANSSSYGRELTRYWGTSLGSVTSYVCDNWLNVRTDAGMPLASNRTYAVILTNGIKPADGGSFARDKDLDALLRNEAPSDAKLAAAHARYAPLRAALAAGKLGSLKVGDILNAAVFTTQKPQDLIAKLASTVATLPTPVPQDVTVCSAGVKSPCDDGGERVCETHEGYVEVHGRLSLPIFQVGEAPYLSEGGKISVDALGNPQVVRTEEVCFALALPIADAPVNGYPLTIYGHGTGGSFKSGIRDLAATVTGAGGAVLSIDLPQHGTRRGGSDLGSDELFYNFLNPGAAAGNVAQGSADLLALIAWARNFNAEPGSAFGRVVKFDPKSIALFGHSQGATHASLILPYTKDVAAAVLSGVGGDLSEALTTKKSPFDIASVMPLLIADPTAGAPGSKACGTTCLGAHHPVYALLQTYFERVDPVNFARGLTQPPEGGSGKHVFMLYGVGDTYAPEGTQKAYAVAGSLPLVSPELAPLSEGGTVLASPVSANVKVLKSDFTVGMRQYKPESDKDGHFVYLGPARADWERFLNAVMMGQTPQIGM